MEEAGPADRRDYSTRLTRSGEPTVLTRVRGKQPEARRKQRTLQTRDTTGPQRDGSPIVYSVSVQSEE